MTKTASYTFRWLIKHAWNVLFMKTGKRASVGEYLIATIFLTLISYVITLITGLIFPVIVALVINVVINIATIVLSFMLIIKRLHDLGKPANHLWFILIPIYNIIRGLRTAFTKGNPGENKYGSDPLLVQPKSNRLYRIFWVLCFVLYMGLSLFSYITMSLNQTLSQSCIEALQSNNTTGVILYCDPAIVSIMNDLNTTGGQN